MAVATRARRVIALSVALLAVGAGAAACGKNATDQPTTTSSTDSQGFGANPAPPPTTTAAPKPPAYPGTAKAYAQAVLAAWKQKQLQRLADLTTPEVHEQIIEIPGPPNQNWTYQRCDGAAGSSYCGFVNTNGDAITLRISNALLGKAHATVEVTLDLTTYPDSAQEYVTEFVEAWRSGNRTRMTKLANATLTDYFTHYTPPDPYSTCTDGAAGSTYVRIYNGAGLDYTVRVVNQELGGPNAITERSAVAAPCP